MDSTAASAPTRVATATRAAGVVYVATGIGFGVGAVISLVYLARNGEFPMTPFGFRSLSGPFEGAWNREAQWSSVGSSSVSAPWKHWPDGGCGRARGVAPRSASGPRRSPSCFGLGFALPFYLASIPIRLVLLALGRRPQR